MPLYSGRMRKVDKWLKLVEWSKIAETDKITSNQREKTTILLPPDYHKLLEEMAQRCGTKKTKIICIGLKLVERELSD